MACERGLVFYCSFSYRIFTCTSQLLRGLNWTRRVSGLLLHVAGLWESFSHLGEYSFGKNRYFLGTKHRLNRFFILCGCRNLLIIALEIKRVNTLFGCTAEGMGKTISCGVFLRTRNRVVIHWRLCCKQVVSTTTNVSRLKDMYLFVIRNCVMLPNIVCVEPRQHTVRLPSTTLGNCLFGFFSNSHYVKLNRKSSSRCCSALLFARHWVRHHMPFHDWPLCNSLLVFVSVDLRLTRRRYLYYIVYSTRNEATWHRAMAYIMQ
jgi:hypothetical protein